jgi:hypothetical protein
VTIVIPILLLVYFLGLAAAVMLTAGIKKRMTFLGILMWIAIYVLWPILFVPFVFLNIRRKK